MPLTDAQKAALNRLQSFYEGDNPYNSVTNPGGFRQGGHLYNFVPALKDLASVIVGCASLAADVVANSAQSPKAVRVDSAQTFTLDERIRGKQNLLASSTGIAGLAQDTKLDGTFAGKLIYTGSAGIKITLPDVTQFPSDASFRLVNISAGPVYLYPQGASLIYSAYGGQTSLTVPAGAEVWFGNDGGNWIAALPATAVSAVMMDRSQLNTAAQRGQGRANLKLAASSYVYLNANRSLTKDDVGTVFYADASYTVTLPLYADCSTGDTIEFYVYGGTLTLAQPAGNANPIYLPGSTAASVALTAGAYTVKKHDQCWRIYTPPNNAVQRSGDTMTGDFTMASGAGEVSLWFSRNGMNRNRLVQGSNGSQYIHVNQGSNEKYFEFRNDGGMNVPQFGDLNNRIEQRGADNQNAAVNRSITSVRLVYVGDESVAAQFGGGMREAYGASFVSGRTTALSNDQQDIVITQLRYRQVQMYTANSGWFASYYA